MIPYNITNETTINQTIEYLTNTTKYATNLEQINQSKGTIIMFLIALIIIGTIFILLYIKKNNKIPKEKQEIQRIKEEIREAISKAEKNQKIKEIDISNLPHDLKTDLLNPESIFSQMFFKGEDKQGHKPPFLFLIRSNMTAEIKHNAKEGEYILEKKDQKETKVTFILTRDKLIDVKIKGKYYRFWVQYEDEAEAYPVKPQHHASQFYNIVLALQMAKQGIQAKKGKFPKILIIIGIVVIIGGIAFYAWNKSHSGNITAQDVNNVINVANTTINNTINNTQGQIIQI